MKDGYYRIKTFERMEMEYGVNFRGSIECEFLFTEEMDYALPDNRIIEIIDDEWKGWAMSEDMVEEYLGNDKPMSSKDWIKLDGVKVPDRDSVYIVFDGSSGRIGLKEWYGNRFISIDSSGDDGLMSRNITHWMNLPEPPEGENND